MKSLSENIFVPVSVVLGVAMVLMGVVVAVTLTQRVNLRLDRLEQGGAASIAAAFSTIEPGYLPQIEQDVTRLQWVTVVLGGAGVGVVYLGLLYIVWSGWKSTTMRRILLEAANAQLEDRVEERVREFKRTNERLQVEVSQRRKAEEELNRSRFRMASAEEGLRKEIAEMLHGKVQTSLLVAWHRLGECEGLLEKDPSEAKALLQEIREELDRIREREVREASHSLHPSVIRVGLLPAVRTLLESFEGEFKVSLDGAEEVVRLDDVLTNRIPEPVRLVAYRVLQEGLSNIRRHAGAKSLAVSVSIGPEGDLIVTVVDDGQGFDVEKTDQGLGLSSIADRVAVAGGEWQIKSTPGHGTTLMVKLPLETVPSPESQPELVSQAGSV
jgi:signal transduction histidine kinase